MAGVVAMSGPQEKEAPSMDWTRRGFGSSCSGIGQIRCPSVENKLTDNPFANRLLIGLGGRVN